MKKIKSIEMATIEDQPNEKNYLMYGYAFIEDTKDNGIFNTKCYPFVYSTTNKSVTILDLCENFDNGVYCSNVAFTLTEEESFSLLSMAYEWLHYRHVKTSQEFWSIVEIDFGKVLPHFNNVELSDNDIYAIIKALEFKSHQIYMLENSADISNKLNGTTDARNYLDEIICKLRWQS